MSRLRNSFLNFFAQTVFSKLTVIAGFIATPLLLEWMGEDIFGTYKLILQWFSYLALLDSIMHATVVGRISQPLGKGKIDEVGQLVKTSLFVALRWLPYVLGLGLVWVYYLPSLISETGTSEEVLRYSGLILLTLVLTFPFAGFRALIDCQQKTYINSTLTTIRGLIVTAGTLLLAYFELSLLSFMALEGALQIIFVSILYFYFRKQIPKFWKSNVTNESKQRIKSLNGPVIVSVITSHIGLIGDTLIIGFVLGAKATTSFVLTQRLAALASTQLMAIGNSSWAGLIELHSKGEQRAFEDRFLEVTKLISGVSLITIVPLCIYNQDFMLLWLRGDFFAGVWVSYFIFINTWFASLSSFWGWLIGGVGLQKEWQPYAIVGTVVNIIISIVGCYLWGFIGPLIGTLVDFVLVRNIGQFYLIQKHYNLKPLNTYLACLKPMLIAIPYAILLYYFSKMRIFGELSWLSLILELGLCFSMGCAFFWFFILDKDGRRAWQERLTRMLKRHQQ